MLHNKTILTRTIVAAVSGLLFAGTAWAQVSASLSTVDNTSQLTGYITQDLSANTVSDWVGAAIVLQLDEGEVYQDGYGNNVEPNGFLAAYYPSLAYDTYMAGGAMGVGVQGAGGDAGGKAFQFDTDRLDASWKGNESGLTGLTKIARVTLTDGATGRWSLALFQKDDDTRYDITGTIVDGVMTIDP
jgi:hypothetical protein